MGPVFLVTIDRWQVVLYGLVQLGTAIVTTIEYVCLYTSNVTLNFFWLIPPNNSALHEIPSDSELSILAEPQCVLLTLHELHDSVKPSQRFP